MKKLIVVVICGLVLMVSFVVDKLNVLVIMVDDVVLILFSVYLYGMIYLIFNIDCIVNEGVLFIDYYV